MQRAAAGEPVAGGELPVGPPPVHGGRVPVLIGGTSDAAVRRTDRARRRLDRRRRPPEMAAPMVERVRQTWRDAGRDGEPRIAALVYFGLGDRGGVAGVAAALLRLPRRVGRADRAVRGADAGAGDRDMVRRFADAGFTELVFDPTVAALDEVDRLADAVL